MFGMRGLNSHLKGKYAVYHLAPPAYVRGFVMSAAACCQVSSLPSRDGEGAVHGSRVARAWHNARAASLDRLLTRTTPKERGSPFFTVFVTHDKGC